MNDMTARADALGNPASTHSDVLREARAETLGADAEWFASGVYVDGPALPLLPKVCRDENGRIDCAVIGGLYRGISNDLKKCPADLQVRVSERWFCHTHRGHACRGNAINLGREIVERIVEASGITPSSTDGEEGGAI